MKQPHVLLKVVAVASAIVLIGGFVSYRAGAFNWLTTPAPAPVEPVVPIEPPSQGYLPAAEQQIAPPTLLPGSKSIAPLINPPSPMNTPAQSSSPP